MVVAAAIPLLIAGPVAGWLADHFSRRTILVSGQFLRVALSATLIFVLIADWSGTAAVLWALGLCTNRVLYNARIASVRHVVRDHELVAANSLSLMLSSVSGVVGASMAILASRYLGSTAMILVIVGHSVAVLMWCRIRTPLGGGAEHVEVTWAEVVKQFRHAKTRYSIVATSSHRLIFGGLLAATALRVDSLATGTTIAFGSVVACNGLGSFLGTLSAEWVNEHLHRKPLTVLTFAATATSTGLSCALDDRFSYLTNVLLVAFFFWTLASVACGLTKNFAALFLARMGVGAGEAPLAPAAFSLLSQSFPRHQLSLATNVYSAGSTIGSGIALGIGGFAIAATSHLGAIDLPLVGTIHS